MNDPDLVELQRLLDRSAFHRWLGLAVEGGTADGCVTLVAPWRDEFASSPATGYAHGGVLASLIDAAGDFALACRLGRAFPTIDMRVDYHRPALPGRLRVTGEVVKLGRTVSCAQASVFAADGTLAASGRAVYLTGIVDKPRG